jgi:hypothetical protein
MTYDSEQLFIEVKRRIDNNIPTSITRYGDGEAIVLNGMKDETALNSVWKRQFGYSCTIDEAKQVKENLIKAYKESDIVGIKLNVNPDLGDFWQNAFNILDKNVGELNNYTSIDFHNDWLTAGKFNELLTGIDTLNYISCRNLDDRFKERYGIKTVNSFIISPEVKFTSGYEGDRHYPDQFRSIERWMKAIEIDKKLCLVGAGVVGKLYNVWFKEKGGISLDIGNVFDLWAGKSTRGPGRGLDAIDNQFKL